MFAIITKITVSPEIQNIYIDPKKNRPHILDIFVRSTKIVGAEDEFFALEVLQLHECMYSVD